MPFLSLKDEQYPHLVFINDQYPYPWTAGFLYTTWLRSALLRVSARGVQMVSGLPRANILEAEGWHAAQCLPTTTALCNFSIGGHLGPANTPPTNMLLFPTGAVDVPDNFHSLTANGHAFLQYFNNSSPCSYSASQRDIVTRDTRYEVSLCDLLNANLDFVLTKDRVFWRQDKTTTAEYVLFSLLGIFIVSQLTSNIMHIIQRGGGKIKAKQQQAMPKTSRNRQTVSTIAHPAIYAAFLLATTIFLTVRTWRQAAQYIVTRQDRAVALTLTLFTWVQYMQHYALVLWSGLAAFNAWLTHNSQKHTGYTPLAPWHSIDATDEATGYEEGDVPNDTEEEHFTDRSFSLLIALLLLLILQVYFTTDTPYSTLMVTLFLARSTHKLLQTTKRQSSYPNFPSIPNSSPFSLLAPAFAISSKCLDIFTALLLVRGLALAQPNVVETKLHVLSVVIVALLLSISMLRLEAALPETTNKYSAKVGSRGNAI